MFAKNFPSLSLEVPTLNLKSFLSCPLAANCASSNPWYVENSPVPPLGNKALNSATPRSVEASRAEIAA